MWFIKRAFKIPFHRWQPNIPISILVTRRSEATESGKGSISALPGLQSHTGGIPKSDIPKLENPTISSVSISSPPDPYSHLASNDASHSTSPSSSQPSLSAPSTNESLSVSAEGSFKHKSFLERLQDMWYERSGTSEILALKESVNEASLAFDQASAQVTLARRHLDEALIMWERTSGQHLQLLQRRESWTSDDAQTFADLVSKEIKARHALEKARGDLAMAEETLSKRQLEYMNRMRRRYHEEQIWQDQWRVLGTYGTWSLIVLNSCVFLASQYFLQRRENTRMKAIEDLVRENNVQTRRLGSIQAAAEDTTFTKSDAKQPTTSQDDIDGLAQQDNDKVGHEVAVLERKEDEVIQVQELGTAKPSSTEKQQPWKQQLHLYWNKFHSAATGQLQRLQSRSKSMLDHLQFKTQELVSAIPGLDEMPKGLSDVDVPSAIVGASVTSAIFLLAMIIFSPRNK